MSYIIISLISLVVGFGGGFLVFHNNESSANKIVASAESDISKVEQTAKSVSGVVASAANTVASDVKKA
jgi:hypothetical protein